MDVATARWLVSDAAGPALAAASAEAEPGSLGAATRLRAIVGPEQAAAVLTQAALRRRAASKFGRRADAVFLTADGLEQATRAPVAARRAARLAASGARRVVDLGCGLGADSLAFLDAGLAVVAIERDEETAVLASANLGQEVVVGDATQVWPGLALPGTAVFADPARRTASGRSWRVEDLTPPWPFVASLLDRSRPACVKLGPGVPHALIADDIEAEWVSVGGSVLECCLWAGGPFQPGRRAAVVDGVELVGAGRRGWGDLGPVAGFLYEPDGAVVRAGLVDDLADRLGAHRLAAGIAYLSGPAAMATPFAAVFRIVEVLPWDERVLRAWVRERRVGTLEIKKRGVDVDPADLRRRLRPKGSAAATLVVTPTASGASVLVCERLRMG